MVVVVGGFVGVVRGLLVRGERMGAWGSVQYIVYMQHVYLYV